MSSEGSAGRDEGWHFGRLLFLKFSNKKILFPAWNYCSNKRILPKIPVHLEDDAGEDVSADEKAEEVVAEKVEERGV